MSSPTPERTDADRTTDRTAVDHGGAERRQVRPDPTATRPSVEREPGGRDRPDAAGRPPAAAPETRVMAAPAAPTAPAAPAAPGPATAPSAASATWGPLQAQFVDDPAAAVRGASELVEQAVKQLLHRSGDHDTEELRAAFLRYRDLYRTLTTTR